MKGITFEEALAQIRKEDPRYEIYAYHFLREALDFTIKLMSKPDKGPERHVSGRELLAGIRKFASQEYGPIAKTVLNRWGIYNTEDIGEVVFNLVEKGILGQTETDSREDFADGYNFDDAFRAPYRPKQIKRARQKQNKTAN